MPETEDHQKMPAELRGRGRPRKVIPKDTRPRMKTNPDLLKSAALEALDAGEEIVQIAARLQIPDATVRRWHANMEAARISLDRGAEGDRRLRVGEKRESRAGLPLKPSRTREEMALMREVDGLTLKHAVFRIVQGDDFKKVNASLKAKGLNKITPVHYASICNLPDVMRSRDAITMIALERGIGNKTKRITELSSIALQVSKRIKEELDKSSLNDKVVKTLLTEYREYSKEIGIETGERVENFNIDALVRQMSPHQLLSMAEISDGDIIDTSFGAQDEEDMDDGGEDDSAIEIETTPQSEAQ